MARWPRFRRADEAPSSARADQRPRQPDRGDAAQRKRRLDDSLATHLSGNAWQRPPSAEELKDAFRKKRRPVESEEKKSEFASQFSNDSLFAAPGERIDGERGDPDAEADSATRPVDYFYDPADPWRTLELDPDAEWPEVVAAHRRMALAFHPDRLTDATPEEKDAAEELIREINIAYSSIKRRMGR